MISRRVLIIHAYWVLYLSFHDFRRDFHGFSKSKVLSWVSIWIWYSKIIIELFKRLYWDMSLHEIFLEFSSKTWVMRPLSREMSYSYETNVLSHELWVMSMSTWVWDIVIMHWVESFRGDCWHSTESIIRWDP